MTFEVPSAHALADAAARCGVHLDAAALDALHELAQPVFEGCRLLDEHVPDAHARIDAATARYPRDAGRVPDPGLNKHGGWSRVTTVRGAASGPLAGRKVAIKDNIYLAGVPMANGSGILDGYVPMFDAAVVTRLLDAGAEIAGKAVCENLCLSGNSFTATSGLVHNPHRSGHSAGGSSSGCGAVVAAGDVDLAIGGDQAGSIRIPSAMCGIHGMKPTFGLVPYTGALPIEPTIDHLGPMTTTVADNALLLEVLAGEDGIDPRQRGPRVHRYTDALGQSVRGMRIAIVEEGFTQPHAQVLVNDRVRAAARVLERLGASVTSVSIPLHALASQLCRPILIEGAIRTIFWGDGMGAGRHDRYDPALMARMHAWRSRAGELSESARVMLVAGTHLIGQHGPRFYAKAMAAAAQLRRHYDDVLARHDLLLMPTTPFTAPELPAEGSGFAQRARAAFGTSVNTFAFNVTGHPAMSVPCGDADGLPVGMMLVARHFDETAIYRAAHAYEQAAASA